MTTVTLLNNPTAGSVCKTLREMRKWGLSVVQARSARQAPIEDQIELARIVARQLLMVAVDELSTDVDDVAHCLIDVSTAAVRHGGFVEAEPRNRIACFDVPMFARSPAMWSVAPDIMLEMAIEACNDRTKIQGLQIVNVETIFQSGFLGFGRRLVSLRVWHLVV